MFPTRVGMNRSARGLPAIINMFPTRVGMNRITRGRPSSASNMFPTRVGMNRIEPNSDMAKIHVPHTRGDEPVWADTELSEHGMFPTRVGMNLVWRAGSGE